MSADSLNVEVPSTPGYAINACHYSKVLEAMNIIENTPGMDEIRMPLSLADGASLAPFDKKRFDQALERGDKYTCGASLFFSNPLRDASPGVPIDTKQVENYMLHYFMDVDNIPRLPHVEIGCEVGGADMLRTSPSEPLHALLFAAAKACAHATAASQCTAVQETISKWKNVLRSLPTTIAVVTGESAKFFASVQARIDATVDAAVLGRQPVQWAAEIVMHRLRLWRLQGGRAPPGALMVANDLKKNLNFKGLSANPGSMGTFGEQLTSNFVDNCLTCHDRLIQYPELVRLVLKYPGVWDSMNKIHVLVYKAGTKQNIQWVLEMLDDMLTTGLVNPDDLSGRSLKGHESTSKTDKGLVAFLIAKRLCKDYLLQYAQTSFGSGWQPAAFVKMHEVFASAPNFRKEMQSLTWQRPLKPSNIRFLEILESVMVGDFYDEQLRAQVNHRRAPADYHMNMPHLKNDLYDVQDMFEKEMEPIVDEPTPTAAVPAGSQQEGDGQQPVSLMDFAEPWTQESPATPIQKTATRLFPKTPLAVLGPYITAAERRVKRTRGPFPINDVMILHLRISLIICFGGGAGWVTTKLIGWQPTNTSLASWVTKKSKAKSTSLFLSGTAT